MHDAAVEVGYEWYVEQSRAYFAKDGTALNIGSDKNWRDYVLESNIIDGYEE